MRVSVTLGFVLADQPGEFIARHLLKELTEETSGPYHGMALRGCVVNQDFVNLILPRHRRAWSI